MISVAYEARKNDNSKEAEDAKSNASNQKAVQTAAAVAAKSGNPYAAAIGKGVQIADKVSGGKASATLGKGLTKANKIAPGGKTVQKATNKLADSKMADKAMDAYNAKNGVSDAQKKELSEVEHIKFLESFSSEPIRRSGDANNSGSVNMADAVTILCSCCNPDEYALTEWGEFNADVNNTGDGITPGDAAKIQRRLVGIEK